MPPIRREPLKEVLIKQIDAAAAMPRRADVRMDIVAPTRLVIVEGTAGDDRESGGLRRKVALMRDRSESVTEA